MNAETEKLSLKFPSWLLKIVNRQIQLNKRYEKAHSYFSEAYGDFLEAIGDINNQFGTEFTFEQANEEFHGGIDDEEYDDDEYEKDED